jgi:hypothetical protein
VIANCRASIAGRTMRSRSLRRPAHSITPSVAGEQCGGISSQSLGPGFPRYLRRRLRFVEAIELRQIRCGAGRYIPNAGNNDEG